MSDAVREAIRRFREGEIVVVTDDDDREDEGDLVCAASLCTPEKMAFIIRHTCGIVCIPLTETRARALNLSPMVATNDAPLGTAFTVSVDVVHGLTTGISAEQRTNKARALANANMGAQDFVRPGHVFPLVSRRGGVLMRSGHTEAAVDLCRLAGLPEVGVICELANDDGTVMKGGQIDAFAREHSLARISVADLIAWRQEREHLVERVDAFTAKSPIGPLQVIAYATPFDSMRHFAFVYGDIDPASVVTVRLHRSDIVGDVLGGALSLNAALHQIREAGAGVIVYLRDGAAGVPLKQEEGAELARQKHWLDVGLGAQILRDLGATRIRTLASRELNYVGLRGFGIEIDATYRWDDSPAAARRLR
jgi:3,4-dihydroxy 2-butanone 4-phosphate synthase / GTP cyclohydrolase II